MNYHRLTEDEREEISRMLARGYSFGDIARFLGRSVSTISNEVNAGGCIGIHTVRLALIGVPREKPEKGKRGSERFFSYRAYADMFIQGFA